MPASTSERRHLRRRAWPALLVLSLLMPGSATANNEVPAGSALRASITDALVRPDATHLARYRWETEPDVIAVYFGADWCGPCHAFVPTLREMRDALREAGANTDVVYASLDTSTVEMRHYMRLQSMPWPAIDPRRLRALPALQALAGPAPPNLVLIDRGGRVIASGWQGRRYAGLQTVLADWLRTSAPPSFTQALPSNASISALSSENPLP